MTITCLDAADLVRPPSVPTRQHAVWLYLRFTLSYRDVEDLLAERGLDVSYETIRRWVGKFGPAIARNLRQLRWPGPDRTLKSCDVSPKPWRRGFKVQPVNAANMLSTQRGAKPS